MPPPLRPNPRFADSAKKPVILREAEGPAFVLALAVASKPPTHFKSVILSEAEGPAFVPRSPATPPRPPHRGLRHGPRPSSILRRVQTYAITGFLLAALFTVPAINLHAQRESPALTEAEVEQLRDSAYVAADRIMVFVKLLDDRTKSIQTTTTGPRRPGREQDLHDLMEQFTSIADELDDNLDEYGPAHRDMRKALPKLLAASERWATILKTPPDNEAYNVSRKLSLEAVRDIRESATKLVDDQRTWFAAHPPPKETKGGESYPTPN